MRHCLFGGVVGETAMALYYDGSGRMRDRKPGFMHGLRTTGVVLKIIALMGMAISLPLWGHFVPNKAH